MFCQNCGKEVDANAVVCTGCGCTPTTGGKFCGNCGVAVTPEQVVCVKCGAALKPSAAPGKKDRVIAGVLAIALGEFGAHMFYLGNMQSAVIRLVATLAGSAVTFGVSAIAMGVIGVYEGVTYLLKSDEEFQKIYVQGQKGWF